jgi:hypothetical protein
MIRASAAIFCKTLRIAHLPLCTRMYTTTMGPVPRMDQPSPDVWAMAELLQEFDAEEVVTRVEAETNAATATVTVTVSTSTLHQETKK